MTEILPVTSENIAYAAQLLKDSHLVSFATETVYGLGGISTSPKAVKAIFKAKGRPIFNPLINHLSSIDDVFSEVLEDFPLRHIAYRLAQNFWPGPLTLILPRHSSSKICSEASAGLATSAFRVPDNENTLNLLKQTALPVAAPSANISGKISPSTPYHVFNDLNGKISAILDDGPCFIGIESTIIDVSSDIITILRPGKITYDDLLYVIKNEDLLNKKNINTKLNQPIAPGQLSSHYAPILPVRINAIYPYANEAFLTFGKQYHKINSPSWNLSLSGNLEEAAAHLYEALHFFDSKRNYYNLKGIAVQKIPNIDIGIAINDRLKRASAPRF